MIEMALYYKRSKNKEKDKAILLIRRENYE